MAIDVNIPIDAFNDAFVPLLDDCNRYNVVYGGAGSGKSVFIAQRYIKRMMENKNRNILIVRKVGKSNRFSTFAEIQSAISQWDVGKLFKVRESDMLIRCVNGAEMISTGLDDVEKIKSIKFKTGPLTDIWIEEASEISENDFEGLDLRLRGISDIPFQVTLSFNPISALSWIKKYFFDKRIENCTILKTTYKDNAWCDEAYKKKLEGLKEKNKKLYDIYALGDWGTLGNLVFTNYEIWDFEKELDFSDTKFINGLDWGFNDPLAGIKMDFYDKEIYILDEMYRNQLTDDEGMVEAEKLWNKKEDRIIADNAEPKSIKKWRNSGWMIKGAMKGKDAVIHGLKWLRNFKINIHPRCQNYINEIQSYVFEEDKDGNVSNQPVDFNNHLMDAQRYGFERKMKEIPLEFI